MFGLEQCCSEIYRGKKETGKRRELQCSSLRNKRGRQGGHGEGMEGPKMLFNRIRVTGGHLVKRNFAGM